MGLRKLTIIVPCTDRKSAAPDPQMTMRSLPAGTPAHRASVWGKRARGVRRHRFPVRDLYRGESWSAAETLAEAAHDAGYRPDVLVASAGMGLLRLDDQVPSYGATFARRQPDSVASTLSGAQEWWRRVNTTFARPDWSDVVGPRVMVVLSETYASALGADLAAMGRDLPGQVLLFGGSTEIDGILRVPVEGALRSHFGGTMNGLAMRMAAEWLRRDSDREFADDRLMTSWRRFVARVGVDETFDRTPMSDEDVMLTIKTYLEEEPNLSRSRALRQFRDSGNACEYKRFMGLFERVAY